MSMLEKTVKPQYSLCERWTASPTSPFHIRQLTAVGMKPSGGADTPALCGAEVTWDASALNLEDLPGMISRQHETFRICTGCAEKAQAPAS